ncbi:MAG TPA: extracellular solute-binding protein [Solirubrobacter sp.]|nr:extracellular solute-binding protein [Solirubrobacter sp.]
MQRLHLVALLVVLALAGCGGGDSLLTIDRVGRADAPKVLKLQINAAYSPQAPTPSVAEGFKKLFVAWARKHPDWRIDLNIIGGSMTTTEQARLLEKAKVGEAPDCANVDSFTIPLFIEQGVLQPLDRYIGKDRLDDLFPYVRRVMTGPDDHVYAWWWSTDLRVIYRRKDLVPKAPRTWDELIAYAKAAERKDPKVDGYLFNGGRWEATTFDNLGYFWMQGGKLLDDQGRPVFAEGDNRRAMLNVFKFLRRTITSGVTPSRVTTFSTYDEFAAAAQAGSVAMFLGGSFQWPTIKEQLGKAFDQWEVSELPGMHPGQTATGTGGWSMAAFSKDPEKVAACVDIIKSIYAGPGNSVTGELPTSAKQYDTLKAFQEPIFKTFRRYLQHAQPRPGLSIYPTLSNQLQIAIGNVLTGGATPEQALDTAGDRVEQTYELLSGGT